MNERICQFSPCRKYRYTLWREWDEPEMGLLSLVATGAFRNPGSYLMVIGLNPSTADETKDDPTIRRCIDFAKRWGFGALCMTNLFAWRDTKPANMKKAADPVGSENDHWLQECAASAGLIVAAWGKHGSHLGRAAQVIHLLPKVHCLRLNGDGSPEHPLYIPAATLPTLYQPTN